MDPFLELQEWSDFHGALNYAIRDVLAPRVEPRYVVRVERRIYFEHPTAGPEGDLRIVDVALAKRPFPEAQSTPLEPLAQTGSVVTAVCELPMPEEQRESYLVIRDREEMEVVTVFETLSPANKGSGVGRQEYLAKRESILASSVHLVELDLLRGGRRLPMVTPLPAADYYAIVSDARHRPRANVTAWTLRDRLPSIRIPLANGDPDIELGLQGAFDSVYDRARYQLSLDYSAPLTPPLSDADQLWVRERFAH
jgi:hypothetical protein